MKSNEFREYFYLGKQALFENSDELGERFALAGFELDFPLTTAMIFTRRETSSMGKCTFKGLEFNTEGEVPAIGSKAPPFKLVASNLSNVTLETYKGKRKVLNVFPSVDTSTCAKSVQRFNKEAAHFLDVVVLNVSLDLPFAHKRFCVTEGIDRCEALSAFRSEFGCDYGLLIKDGPLEGLLSRAVIILDDKDRIVYLEHVSEIANEPNYDAAMMALRVTKPSVITKE